MQPVTDSAAENRLLIAGVSARAAAQSAVAAGFDVVALDRFGDADLRRLCETRTFSAWDELPALAEEFSPRPWIYTGGMENRPELIALISRRHELLGCDVPAVNAVRDACDLAKAVSAAGFLMPETRTRPPANVNGAWLQKPQLSGGGVGIARWEFSAERNDTARPQIYQRLIPGDAYGAVFLAAAGETTLWGVSRQLLAGELQQSADPPPLGPFQYCGSLGPVDLPEPALTELRRLGRWMAEQFDLRGMFGIDFVLKGNRPWLIEVNPRYTASAEVLERATGQSAITAHVIGCRQNASCKRNAADRRDLPDMRPTVGCAENAGSAESNRLKVVGKLFLYANERTKISAASVTNLLRLNDERGTAADVHVADLRVADIPQPGTIAEPGQPLFTLLVEADSLERCQALLMQQATRLRSLC